MPPESPNATGDAGQAQGQGASGAQPSGQSSAPQVASQQSSQSSQAGSPLSTDSGAGPLSGLTLDQPGWDDSPGSADAGAGAGGSDTLPGGQQAAATEQGQATAAQQAAERQWSIQEAARQFGVDLSRFSDPTEALASLIHQARAGAQNQQLADYGHRYLQNAREFEDFLAQRQQEQRSQQAAAGQQGQQQRPSWEPPPWDPDWLNQVVRDDQGRLVPAPGAPPTVVQDIRRRQRWEEATMRSFLENPGDFINRFNPFSEQQQAELEQRVFQRMQQSLGLVAQTQQDSAFLQQNADLLYAHNQAGQIIVNPQTGRPYPSADAQELSHYLQQLSVPNHLQQEFARLWINHRRAARGQQATQPQQQVNGGQGTATAPAAPAPLSPHSNGNPVDADFIRRAAGYGPDAGGSLAPPPPRPDTAPSQNPRASLEDKLRLNFQRHGITDAAFADV